MLFNSLSFLVFFLVLLVIYYNLPSWKHRKILLLMSSYLFYGAWNPPFLILLWFSTIVDWLAAKWLATEENGVKRNVYLMISLVSNLGLLGYFKYGEFLLGNLFSIFSLFGLEYNSFFYDITLPVGISFYTFQTLSYTLDVYFKRCKPSESFIDFSLYVTFFPQLVAGPIVRSTDFLPQCEEPKKFEANSFFWGLFMLTLGLFQKVVLADTLLAPSVDKVFGFSKGLLHPLDAWVGVLGFSGQIFFDFSGYSTCAIGIALCFGFCLPDNFRFPYAAIGFSNFWQRWHISLSSWLKDYLYIPLGGNRKTPSRTLINIMIFMLLGGLWHGASWTFVVWGGLHGIYLIIERILRLNRNELGKRPFIIDLIGGLLTYFLVTVTWVFFREQSFPTAISILKSMFGFVQNGAIVLPTYEIVQVSLVSLSLVIAHWILRDTDLESAISKIPAALCVVSWSFMLFIIVLAQGGGNAFIYFQF